MEISIAGQDPCWPMLYAMLLLSKEMDDAGASLLCTLIHNNKEMDFNPIRPIRIIGAVMAFLHLHLATFTTKIVQQKNIVQQLEYEMCKLWSTKN